MKLRDVSLVIATCLLARTLAFAQPKPAPSDEERVERAQQVLEQTEFDLKPFLKKKMTLAELLAALQANLPADKKLAFRVDGEGLGKDLAKVTGATVMLEGTSEGRGLELVRLLRWGIGAAKEKSGLDLDYAVRPDGVVVSFPRFAIYRYAYDIPARFGRSDATAAELRTLAPAVRRLDKQGDDLARLLTTTIPLRPGEAVELVNGTRLIVSAAGDRHEQFHDLLDQCGRLLDLSAVMNARLFEIDNAFYEKNVAPLFSANDSPPVVRLDGPTFQKFASVKPLAVSDGMRLRHGAESVFLARQLPFRAPAGAGLEGVSFAVDPGFSADRRFIRLKITQTSTRLVGVKKTDEGDTLDLRSASATGVVQIPEMAPVLMRVDYRPAGEAGKGKHWVMVARPMIWIDREARERYLGEPQDTFRVLTPPEVDRLMKERGVTIAGAAAEVWKSDVVPSEDDPIEKEPAPGTQIVKDILHAVISDVLKNPKLKDIRDFYGTPGDDSFVIDSGAKRLWPTGFVPRTPGMKLVKSAPEPFSTTPRVLGIRLSEYHAPDTDPDVESWPEEAVHLEIFNAGGSGNGAVSGHAHAWYSVKRDGKRWIVKLGHFQP